MGVEVTRDEADKKMAAGIYDPLSVKNKDPNYHYRWLRKERLNLTRKRDFLKYEIVQGGPEEGVCSDNTPMKASEQVSGQVEVGDLVLARIPKELHEEYRRRNREKVNALATGVTASFKAAVGDRGYEEHRDVPGYAGSVTRDDIDLEETS
jgi:hypothetical protein